MSEILTSSLTLMRRLPPALSDKSLAGLNRLIDNPEVVDQVCQRVDKPLKISQCLQTGGDFILCEYNRDGRSYRCPISNQYQPATSEAFPLRDPLRRLEVKANEVFNEYRRLYYEGGVSSVYFWEVSGTAFACAFLIKKDCDPGEGITNASWESSNLIQAEFDSQSKAVRFNITSTVYLAINSEQASFGGLNLSGALTRQQQEHKPCSDLFAEGNVYHMIALVENMESKLRGSLDMIYISKTQEILDRTRHVDVQKSRVKLA
jgi:capping protein beta